MGIYPWFDRVYYIFEFSAFFCLVCISLSKCTRCTRFEVAESSPLAICGNNRCLLRNRCIMASLGNYGNAPQISRVYPKSCHSFTASFTDRKIWIVLNREASFAPASLIYGMVWYVLDYYLRVPKTDHHLCNYHDIALRFFVENVSMICAIVLDNRSNYLLFDGKITYPKNQAHWNWDKYP